MEYIKDIETLSSEDLLSLYSTVCDHLLYLEKQIIVLEEENESGGENNE